ncbi:MAG: hypothetical protein QM737_21645 [Ferruginibacter sp.]
MKLTKLFTAFLVFFLVFKNCKAQSPDEALENVRLNYASEKIFIHYDKGSYVAGETIWFKAYFLSGFLPAVFSSSMCVELLNDSGRIVDRKILPVINSTAVGNFDLPRDASQMNYTVRAYTGRLMDFGPNSFYYHKIPVFNPSDTKAVSDVQKQFNIYFLPESGNLICGIKNVVAFKCTDQWGYPADAEGKVTNAKGETIATFISVHDGMGKFEITPVLGEKYTAAAIIDKNINKQIELPASVGSGALLSVRKENGKEYFYVNSETVFNENLRPAYMLAVMENTVVFKIRISSDQKSFKGQIPVENIPSGILQLTLFNRNDQPITERLMFVSNKDYVANGNLKTDTVSTADRGRNVFSYELQDSLDGSFSVSVTDSEREINLGNADNIISRFLVSNDIKGYVHNPQYYFETDDDERKNNLDLVMLTNGWRKFTWDQVLTKNLPLISFKDPNYISLKGKAVYDGTDKSIGESNLSVIIKTVSNGSDVMIVPVNKDGIFEISGLSYADTASLYFSNLIEKNKKINATLFTPTISSLFKFNTKNAFQQSRPLAFSDKKETIKNMYSDVLTNLDKKTVLLSEIKLVSKAKSKTKLLEERYIRNGVFNSYAAATIDFVNDPMNKPNNSTNVVDYIRGKISGVSVLGTPGNYYFNYRSTRSLQGGPIPMDIFLDESQVYATSDISSIPMSEIAMIKVYGTGFVGSAGGGPGGAIAIYTRKTADLPDFQATDKLFRLKVEGYSPVKEFFSPDYAPGKPAVPALDSRSTLYWDPYLETSQSYKKFSFSFYNADHVRKMKLVLEGMTSDGKLIHLEKMIE